MISPLQRSTLALLQSWSHHHSEPLLSFWVNHRPETTIRSLMLHIHHSNLFLNILYMKPKIKHLLEHTNLFISFELINVAPKVKREKSTCINISQIYCTLFYMKTSCNTTNKILKHQSHFCWCILSQVYNFLYKFCSTNSK